MIEFVRKYYSSDNDVNEDTVIGTLFAVCTIVAGFVPAIGVEITSIFSGMTLLFFGKNVLKGKGGVDVIQKEG